MALISFEQAVAHLRLTIEATSPATAEEADLRIKMLAAESVVLDYLKIAAVSPPTWDADTVPALVQAAILLQLGELWRFRGDDPDGQGPAQTDGDLSPIVTNILRRYRDPAVA